MAATVAGLDPEMAPNTVHVPTTVRPRLPRNPPTIESTQSMMRLDMPPRPINSPAKMKKGTAIRANLSMLPNMTWWVTVIGMSRNNMRTIAEVASRMTKMGKPRARRTNGITSMTQPTAVLPPDYLSVPPGPPGGSSATPKSARGAPRRAVSSTASSSHPSA